jgi:hypothetical protein
MFGNSSAWNIQHSIPIGSSMGQADLLDEISVLDNHIYNDMKSNGNTYFG